MLILNRKLDESIQIGDDIFVTVTRICKTHVRLGITAPPSINVKRIDKQLGEDERTIGRASSGTPLS